MTATKGSSQRTYTYPLLIKNLQGLHKPAAHLSPSSQTEALKCRKSGTWLRSISRVCTKKNGGGRKRGGWNPENNKSSSLDLNEATPRSQSPALTVTHTTFAAAGFCLQQSYQRNSSSLRKVRKQLRWCQVPGNRDPRSSNVQSTTGCCPTTTSPRSKMRPKGMLQYPYVATFLSIIWVLTVYFWLSSSLKEKNNVQIPQHCYNNIIMGSTKWKKQ